MVDSIAEAPGFSERPTQEEAKILHSGVFPKHHDAWGEWSPAVIPSAWAPPIRPGGSPMERFLPVSGFPMWGSGPKAVHLAFEKFLKQHPMLQSWLPLGVDSGIPMASVQGCDSLRPKERFGWARGLPFPGVAVPPGTVRVLPLILDHSAGHRCCQLGWNFPVASRNRFGMCTDRHLSALALMFPPLFRVPFLEVFPVPYPGLAGTDPVRDDPR